MSYDMTILRKGAARYGITLTEKQEEQFIRYYELLIEWNKVMNLTGITEFEQVLLKHFTDSLSLAGSLDLTGIRTCVDVGTGAGFPGLVIKIIYPIIRIGNTEIQTFITKEKSELVYFVMVYNNPK